MIPYIYQLLYEISTFILKWYIDFFQLNYQLIISTTLIWDRYLGLFDFIKFTNFFLGYLIGNKVGSFI